MSTFAQILNKFRQDAFSERDKGYRTVSLETMKIVRSLPKFKLEE